MIDDPFDLRNLIFEQVAIELDELPADMAMLQQENVRLLDWIRRACQLLPTKVGGSTSKALVEEAIENKWTE